MNKYPKIKNIFKHDDKRAFINGDWSCAEFKFLARTQWFFTEKVDGINIRIMWKDGNVQFGGKTDSAQLPATLVNRLNQLFRDDSGFISAFPDCTEVCLYGEGYGAGIQKGSNHTGEPDFVLFDVKIGEWWLRREDVENIGMKMGLQVVPYIGQGTLYEGISRVTNGFFAKGESFQAEGIVAFPMVEMNTRKGERIITKIKSCDFK